MTNEPATSHEKHVEELEAIEHLEQELEGWIVGLHLVGLVLRNQPDPEAFLSGLKGGFQRVYDYLSEQVLAGQPEWVRECLLQTSILSRFCVSLVEAVTAEELDFALALGDDDGHVGLFHVADLVVELGALVLPRSPVVAGEVGVLLQPRIGVAREHLAVGVDVDVGALALFEQDVQVEQIVSGDEDSGPGDGAAVSAGLAAAAVTVAETPAQAVPWPG